MAVTVALDPAQVDITGVRAHDRNQFMITLNSAAKPVNITGYTVTAQARATPTTPDSQALSAVVEVVDVVKGKVTIRWPGDEVADWLGNLTTKQGAWDLQLDDGVLDPW